MPVGMDIVLTGSIAFDYIMKFPGHFKDHILPDKLECLSLSFLVESLVRHRGGIAPNIAYTIALLGGKPRVLATAGEDFEDYRSWLEEQGVAGIGFGWINLRKGGDVRELLEWPYEVEQPIAPAITEWAEAAHVAVTTGTRLRTAVDLQQETLGVAGAADPATIVVRRQRGLRRARQVDTVLAAALGACDGDLPIGAILAAVAELTDRDPAATTEQYLPEIVSLVRDGYLVPVAE